METAVCVLAHGEADEVDESTHWRIYRAVNRLRGLKEEGASKLVLVCMAGVGKKYSEITLASRMAEEARFSLDRAGILKDVRILYNRYERKVWGSALEMRWAEAELKRECPHVRVEYVTNARHAKRIRLTRSILGLGPSEVVISSDSGSPLIHETLAYLKLGAYVVGLGDWAETRRRRYSGG